MQPWERFLEKYTRFGRQPTRENHRNLFAGDALIRHPGMAAPMGVEPYVDFVQESLKRLREYHLIPIHCAHNSDTVFVEARNTAVVEGRPVEWPATYVVTLRDEMVIRGRAHYDRLELLAHLEPGLSGDRPNAHVGLLEGVAKYALAGDDPAYADRTQAKFVAPYAANWQDPNPQKFVEYYAEGARMINPGFERPLRRDELTGFYKSLIGGISGLRLTAQSWAAVPGLLFIEWLASGEIAGQKLDLPVADRFTLNGDILATEGVAYFDNLAVRAMVDPDLGRFKNATFAGEAPR